MCSCGFCKHQFVPHKKKTGPYLKTNAYTQPIAGQQVLTLVLFLAQLALHSVFVVPPLDNINSVILWVLLGLHYAFLLVIIYDYVFLTITDPVDRLVVNQELVNRFRAEELTFCVLCDRHVHQNSYHCFRCDRCTEDFDHHCKFLNNCIGGLNYQSFFRLLLIDTLYNINIIGSSAYIFRRNLDDSSIAFNGNQWGLLALIILSVLIQLAVGALLIFHCYISLCEMTTTLGYNYPEKKKKSIINPTPKIEIQVLEPPVTENRLTRQGQEKIIV